MEEQKAEEKKAAKRKEKQEKKAAAEKQKASTEKQEDYSGEKISISLDNLNQKVLHQETAKNG